MTRVRALRAERERGFGLPELLVTVMLLGIVTLLVVGLFSAVTGSMTQDRAATDSTNTAANGLNELSRVIRSGTEIQNGAASTRPVFTIAQPETLELHALLDTDSLNPMPVKVRFTVNGARELVEQRWPANPTSEPNWTFSGTVASTRVIARTITPGAAVPVFQYYDSYDRTATPMTVPAGGLTEAQRRSVVRVGVSLSVQADVTNRADPVVISNLVGIPNRGVDLVGAATP